MSYLSEEHIISVAGNNFSNFLLKKNKGGGVKILLHGDSTTDENSNGVAYDTYLRNEISSNDGFLPGATIVNAGQAGYLLHDLIGTETDTSQRHYLGSVVAAAPDLIIFSFGINDVKQGFPQFDRTQAQVEFDLRYVLTFLLKSLPNVIILARMPNPLMFNDTGQPAYTLPTLAIAKDCSQRLRNAYRNLINFNNRVAIFNTWAEAFPLVNNDPDNNNSYSLLLNNAVMVDGYHPTPLGFNLEVRGIVKMLFQQNINRIDYNIYIPTNVRKSAFRSAYLSYGSGAGYIQLWKDSTTLFPNNTKFENLNLLSNLFGSDTFEMLIKSQQTGNLRWYFPDTGKDEAITFTMVEGPQYWQIGNGSIGSTNYTVDLIKTGIVIFYVPFSTINAHPIYANLPIAPDPFLVPTLISTSGTVTVNSVNCAKLLLDAQSKQESLFKTVTDSTNIAIDLSNTIEGSFIILDLERTTVSNINLYFVQTTKLMGGLQSINLGQSPLIIRGHSGGNTIASIGIKRTKLNGTVISLLKFSEDTQV